MFYISDYNRTTKKYGITDTEDGITEYFTKAYILRELKGFDIMGVAGNTIKVVNAATQVVQNKFDAFESAVRKAVDGWTVETCMEIARSAHFVKKIKGLPDAEVKHVTMENIYPQSVREAVEQAADFSNNVLEVDCKNRQAMIDALRNNVCVVLQHKTNGVLTSFMCTGNLSIMDSVYESMFFDSVYLTKQLYGYTVNIEKVRPRRTSESKEKNPSMLNVFSCALRFRREGAKHDGVNKELSSPFYTVNLDKVLGMYILVNPYNIGNRIIPEFKMTSRKDTYNFDFKMWKEVRSCLASGVNYFKNDKVFMQFIDTDTLTHSVELTDVIARFDEDWKYMEYLRREGYSFKV